MASRRKSACPVIASGATTSGNWLGPQVPLLDLAYLDCRPGESAHHWGFACPPVLAPLHPPPPRNPDTLALRG